MSSSVTLNKISEESYEYFREIRSDDILIDIRRTVKAMMVGLHRYFSLYLSLDLSIYPTSSLELPLSLTHYQYFYLFLFMERFSLSGYNTIIMGLLATRV